MLKIRFTQRGKKNQRFYLIIVTDSRNSRDTKNYLDVLGYWDREKKEFKIDIKKYEEYLSKGAQPTNDIRRKCKENMAVHTKNC